MKVTLGLLLFLYSLALFAEEEPAKEKAQLKISKSQGETKTDNTKTDNTKKDNKVEEREKKPDPNKLLKVGNLAFPVSQQPSPLISFGQNIINKNQFQFLFLTNYFRGNKEYFINTVPSILYGFADDISLLISYPIAVRYRQRDRHSSGPGDLIIQGEYAIWTKEHRTYYDAITLTGSVTIPTGSATKNPNTGIGANSFFLGATFSRMEINWFYFTSYGGTITASSHRRRFGNQFLYQYGVGRRIYSNKDWLFDWMVEFDGQYTCRNEIRNKVDPNSGGNIIYVTPSIFISSSEHLIFQLGVGVAVYQHLFGHQLRKRYFTACNILWSF